MITTRLAALATTAALSLAALAGTGAALASSGTALASSGTALASTRPAAATSCTAQISHWSAHEGYWRLRALDLYTAHLLDLYTLAPPTVAQTARLLTLSRASRQIPPPACVVDNGYYWVIGRNAYAAASDARQHQDQAAEADVQAADRNETALTGQIRDLYHFHGRFPAPPETTR